MKNELISVKTERLSKKMLETQALKDINVFFEAGEIHGIIGPDGAGKTTLIRLMASLLKADSGRIYYCRGKENFRFKDIKTQTAYFPQEQSLYPDLSCEEHLEFFASIYNVPQALFKERAEELFNMTAMTKFAQRKAGNLSGGMYKKLGLMCVLLNRPKLLFLDEPTIGVDPLSRRELWELMYSLAQDKMTIILSTSYMDEAERCAKVHLLDRGSLKASGTPEDVLKKFNAGNFEEIFLSLEKE